MQNDLNILLDNLNTHLRINGLLPIALVDPKDCIGQEKNARYFEPEYFKQLVTNIAAAGNLESVPLVYPHETKKGQYRIISGHHRIEAAKEAGLKQILVFLDDLDPSDKDTIVSKQLAHNALTGKDDKAILSELFNSINNIELKLATGLHSEIEKIDYVSLNFKLGAHKEMVLMFLPSQIDDFDNRMEDIASLTMAKPSSAVRTACIDQYDKFADALRKIKKIENIKNNGMAVMTLIELAERQIELLRMEKEDNGSKKK